MALSNAERQQRHRQRLKDEATEAAALRRQVEALTAEVDRLRAGAPAGFCVGPLDPHPVPLDTLTDGELVEVTRQRSAIVQPALDWLDEPGRVLQQRVRDLEAQQRARLAARGVEVAALVRKATRSKHSAIAALARGAGVDARWVVHLIERDAAPSMADGSEWIESRRVRFLDALASAASRIR